MMVANLYHRKTHEEIAMSFNPFSDLPSNHRAAEAVVTLARAGIEEGYGDGTFRGNRNITKGELRTMLNNLFRVTGVNSKMKDNPDDVNDTITRYQLAVTLNKVYKVLFN
ncbi:MAG: S-layer homology domain-containing protein [Selenomonadaceae bacterium]|nr:S-layer homology domain-containing protein [Selenomonadaceae bacterium]